MTSKKICSVEAAGRVGTARLLALVLFVAYVSALPARASTISASLAVTVVVPPRAVLSVESGPSSLKITEEDVARGYVDVPKASRLQIRTNTLSGWLVEFQVEQGPYRSIEVTGLGGPSQVSASGGWIAQPYPGTTRPVPLELGYRFLLSADARPGVYPWPVALAAMPR